MDRLILALCFVFCLGTSMARADECQYASEDQIKQAISEEPERVVKIIDGQNVQGFFSILVKHGYATGTFAAIDHVYIVDAGKLPGYTVDQVWIYFVSKGCLISSTVTTKETILNILGEL